jgi:hypothetical protein
VRREGCQEVAALHSSDEAGERPFRTRYSEGGDASWTGGWNHAEDTAPRKRVTAKPPDRVGDSEPRRDERVRLTSTPGLMRTEAAGKLAPPLLDPSTPLGSDPRIQQSAAHALVGSEAHADRVALTRRPRGRDPAAPSRCLTPDHRR